MRIKDWGYTVAVLGVCFLLMCGCDSRSDEGLSLSNGPDAVYLDINVALRDASASGRSVSGRAEEEMYGEVTEAEKMHTLRVILVRPDGRVEHNVYLDLKNASVSDRYGKIRLKVQGNEEKTIYLLGNEGSASVELPAVEGEVKIPDRYLRDCQLIYNQIPVLDHQADVSSDQNQAEFFLLYRMTVSQRDS